jgi:hypothetical protein
MLPSYERLQSSEDSSRQVSHDDSCEKSYVQEDIVKCFKAKHVFHIILILSIILNATLIYAHNYGTKGLVQRSKYGKYSSLRSKKWLTILAQPALQGQYPDLGALMTQATILKKMNCGRKLSTMPAILPWTMSMRRRWVFLVPNAFLGTLQRAFISSTRITTFTAW